MSSAQSPPTFGMATATPRLMVTMPPATEDFSWGIRNARTTFYGCVGTLPRPLYVALISWPWLLYYGSASWDLRWS
jgi:hypothetical protein